MKFFILLMGLVLNTNLLPAQVKKTPVKPEVAVKPLIQAEQKLIDSIIALLTAGKSKTTYIIFNGKKKNIPDNSDYNKQPRLQFTKEGIFKTFGQEKYNTKTTWQLSDDAKYFITKEENITERFKITILTKDKLEFTPEGEPVKMGFALEKR